MLAQKVLVNFESLPNFASLAFLISVRRSSLYIVFFACHTVSLILQS